MSKHLSEQNVSAVHLAICFGWGTSELTHYINKLLRVCSKEALNTLPDPYIEESQKKLARQLFRYPSRDVQALVTMSWSRDCQAVAEFFIRPKARKQTHSLSPILCGSLLIDMETVEAIPRYPLLGSTSE